MLRNRLRGIKSELEQQLRKKLQKLSERDAKANDRKQFRHEAPADLAQVATNPHELETSPDDPPVVARLMVEIRSDGTRTVARGALKDELSGEQVSLVAKGSSPLSLAAQLAKSLLTTPLAAAQLARSMRRVQHQEPEFPAPTPNEPSEPPKET